MTSTTVKICVAAFSANLGISLVYRVGRHNSEDTVARRAICSFLEAILEFDTRGESGILVESGSRREVNKQR